MKKTVLAVSVCLVLQVGCKGELTVSSPTTTTSRDAGSRGASPDSGLPPVTDGDGGVVPVDPPPPPPPPPVYAGELAVSVGAVTSSSVELSWPAVEGATSIVVTLGAEPPETAGGPLAGALEEASLPATATSYALSRIAAATDVFVHVEARRADGTAVAGVAHARTNGGGFATLDTPLRSVHAFGPSVLELVIHDPATHFDGATHVGNDGADWQSGTWTVTRADGRALGAAAVHRETVPAGQPDYAVGYDMYGDASIVDLEHRIFVVLAEPLGALDVLQVRHSGATATTLDVRVPWSDRYLETPLLHVNQVGYNPRATRRWAYVSGYMGDGGSVDVASLGAAADVLAEPLDALGPRRVAATDLTLVSRVASDPETGLGTREIDLATVPAAEGVRYRVHIPGVGVSFPTAVSEEAAMRAYWVSARGLFHNRWCGDLQPTTTEWSRPADHCVAYWVSGSHYATTDKFPMSTSLSDMRPLRGGHHDAGDFDIRPFHVVVAEYLMRAYEIDPTRFSDSQLVLPESGNGVPDLLDEALWSVGGWQALQNPDGTIRAGVESWAHPRGTYLANDDRLTYWTYDPEPWHTAYVAALFAQSARLVRPFDAARSATLETAARAAYGSPIFGAASPAIRVYAASELFALTHEARFGTDFATLWHSLDRSGGGPLDGAIGMREVYPGWFPEPAASSLIDFVMGYATATGADPAFVAAIRARVRSRADGAANAILDSPAAHRNGRHTGEAPDWGHATATGRQVDGIYQALQLGGLPADVQQRYFDALSVAADYALGCNPDGQVWMTGLGTTSPRQPLHLDSLVWTHAGMRPVPGIPEYGPVSRLPTVYYYLPVTNAYFPGFDTRPVALRSSDNRTSVNTSEFSVWEMQAPQAELFAALLGPGRMPPASWLPGGALHRATIPAQRAE